VSEVDLLAVLLVIVEWVDAPPARAAA